MAYRIYLLTNKVTFARAVVVASSPLKARMTHPTKHNGFTRWDTTRWVRDRGGHFSKIEVVEPPTGWTARLDLLHATELGTAYEDAYEVLAYEPSTELRQPGDGPDATWGGYTLSDLNFF